MRCDDCGRYTKALYDVWIKDPYPSIDRTVCPRCAQQLGINTEKVMS